MGQIADLVVVGAGIAGAGTAFFAAQTGLRVTVLEQDLPAFGRLRADRRLAPARARLGPAADAPAPFAAHAVYSALMFHSTSTVDALALYGFFALVVTSLLLLRRARSAVAAS